MADTTCHMSISLDGFVAGPDQSREDPLGKRGGELHGWHIGDAARPKPTSQPPRRLMRPRGAYVMGRNMFGPIRGEWNEEWSGWWGSEPPYQRPVFVLTHHAPRTDRDGGRDDFPLRHRWLRRRLRAGPRDGRRNGVDIAGGASTVRQALLAGVIDELLLDIVTRFTRSPARGMSTASRVRFRARRGAPLTAGDALCCRRAGWITRPSVQLPLRRSRGRNSEPRPSVYEDALALLARLDFCFLKRLSLAGFELQFARLSYRMLYPREARPPSECLGVCSRGLGYSSWTCARSEERPDAWVPRRSRVDRIMEGPDISTHAPISGRPAPRFQPEFG